MSLVRQRLPQRNRNMARGIFAPRGTILALETRTLFDGSPVAGAEYLPDQHAESPETSFAAPSAKAVTSFSDGSTAAVEPSRRELVFIDPAVAGWQEIVAGIRSGVEIIVLDPARSALDQIATGIGSGAPVDALHLISHGAEGVLKIGDIALDLAALPGVGTRLADIGAGLTSDADVLLYGCDIGRGAGGGAFLSALARATGADIAASIDATGATLRGGNWQLEQQTGRIEATALAARSFDGLLAAPVIADAAAAARTLAEDATTAITGITIADADALDTQTLTLSVLHGTLTLASTVGLSALTGNASASVSFTGTLTDVNAAIAGMTYTPTFHYHGSDTLTVDCTDSTSAAATQLTAAISITATNDAPTLAPTALTVQESAANVAFGAANLGLADPDITSGQQVPAQMIIEINSLPTRGTLTFNGFVVAIGSVFSQPQIASLKYTHDGSNVTAGDTDAFNVVVHDGGGGSSALTALNVTLTPTNDAPSASSSATQYEGQVKSIGFAVTDRDDALATAVTVSVTSLDAQGHGSFFLDADNDGIVDPGEALIAGSSTFAADQASKVKFAHDGDEADAFAPTITFAITDSGGGEGPGAAATTSHTANVTVLANDDDPVLDVNTGLTAVAPGAVVAIPSTALRYTDVDSTTTQLVYTVETRPQYGSLQFFDGSTWKNLGIGATFTQKDIDDGKLRYEQNTQSAGATSDAFTFKLRDSALQIYDFDNPGLLREGGVRDLPGDLTLATRTFDLAFSAPNTTGLLTVPGADPGYGGNSGSSVDSGNGTQPQANTGTAAVPPPGPLEGGTGTITNTILSHAVLRSDFIPLPPTQVIYILTSPSSNGTLKLNGVALSTLDRFTQDDVNNSRITWQQDGGENMIGSIAYSVSDGGPNRLFTSFQVEAQPINDAPTASGSTLTLGEAVSGNATSGIARITAATLNLGDVDNAQGAGKQTGADNAEGIPDQLWFRITTLPLDGSLQRWDGAAWVAHTDTDMWLPKSLLTLSADGGTSGLRYVHGGDDQPANLTDSFNVQVRDNLSVATSETEARTGQSDPTLNVDAITGRNAGSGAVNLSIIPLNDPPLIAVNEAALDPSVANDPGYGTAKTGANQVLTVVEGGTGDITGGFLQTVDSDNDAVQRQYRITTNVAFGKLTRDGATLGAGSTFTQKDIDEGKIKYVHNGTENFADHFNFVVSDGVVATAISRFDILVTPTNDAPTLTAPSGPINIDSAVAANNPVGIFVLDDAELSAVSPGETDYVQVTVRLLTSAGAAFAAGTYTTGGNTTLDVVLSGAAVRDGDKDGTGDYLVIRGTKADVNATLASLTVTFPDDRDALYKVQVVVDDRLRDGAGVLTAGANGGTLNQNATPGGTPTAVPNDEFDWYAANEIAVLATDPNRVARSVTVRASSVNDAPTFSGPGSQTINEDLATYIGGFSVADVESTNFDLPVTMTLSVPAGHGTLGVAGAGAQTTFAVGGRTVTIGGDNSATLTLTGRADDIQTLLNDTTNGLFYTSPAHGNHDYNGGAADDVTLTASFSEGTAAIGGDVGGGSVANAVADVLIPIILTPTNDAPTVAATGGTVAIAAGATATAVSGFVINDVDYTDGGAPASTTGESDFVQVTVRITDNAGTPLAAGAYTGTIAIASSYAFTEGANFEIDDTLAGTGTALVIRGTRAEVNNYLGGLTVAFSGGLANADSTYRVQVIADDRLRNVTTGVLDAGLTANGGKNPDGADPGTAPDDVPSTAIDPYAAIPGGLTQNVASGFRNVFVSGTNDPAQVSASNVTVDEGSATLNLTALVGAFAVADPDDNGASNLSATVTVSKGVISAVGGSGGTVGGTGTATVTITGATEAQLNARLQALTVTFPDEADSPTSADWNGSFSVSVAVNDGGNIGARPGALTGDTDDATANPGDYSYFDGVSANLVTTRTITVNVTAVNDAPVRTDATAVTLTAASEDVPGGTGNTPPGDTVSNLFGGKFNDALDGITGGSSANTLAGIAITTNAAVSAQGEWQYSTDGNTWTNLPSVSTSSAILLKSTDSLRFVPTSQFYGTPGGLTVRLVDSSGAAITTGSTVDVSNDTTLSGGTTRYSNSSNTVTLTTGITSVNDAPTLTSASLSAVNEDVTSASNAGAVISTLFSGKYSDLTDDQSGVAGGGASTATAFAGLAILGNTANAGTEGKWQYSVTPGTWVDLPTGTSAGDANSVLLPTSASLRFQPVANYNGTPPALSVAALDTSTGGAIIAPTTGQTIAATGGTTRFSTPTTVAATVSPINDAPTIAALSGSPAFVENASTPVRLDSDGSVTAADLELGNNWNSATLAVRRSGTPQAQDVFSFIDDDTGNASVGVQTSGANLVVDGVTVGTFTNASGTLTVTFNASATAALVGKAMGAVAYVNTSDAPPASAQINFVLNDKNSNVTGGGTSGGGQNQGGLGQLSATGSVTVAITRINDAPSISGLDATRSGNYVENGAAVQIDSNALLADPELDATNWNKATLTVARNGGASTDDVFGATGTLGLTGSGSGHVVVSGVTVGTYTQAGGTITITFNTSATAARADSVLRGLTYLNSSEDPPASVTLAVTVNDQNPNVTGGGTAGSGVDQGNLGRLTATGTIAINITRSNDAPVISAAPPAAAYTEQATAVAVDAGLALSDVDDTQINNASVTIASAVTGDLLAVDTTGTSVSASFAGGVLTLSGADTVANYQQVLRTLVFSSTSDDPTVNTTRNSRSLTVSVTDANSDGAGAKTTTSLRTVNLTPVNDTPTIASVGSTRSYTENAAAVTLEPGLALADVDDTQMDQAVISIASGFVAGDRLNFSNQNGISGSYDGATGVLTLTGSATLVNYETALRSIGFDSTSENPGSGVRTVSWTVRDVDSDAAPNGKQTSLAGTTTVNLTPVNDDPVAANDANSIGKASATPVTGSVLTNDSDIDGGTLGVTAVAGGTLGAPLAGTNGYGSLTLNADGTYSFAVDTANPTVAALGAGATLTETYTYTISDGQGGTASATLTITINGSNNPPVAVADGNSITEGTASVSAAASGVLGNDSDLNGDTPVVIGIAAGANQSAGSAIPVPGGGATATGTYGALTLMPDGSYSYALDNANPAVNALATGQSVTDTFTYVVGDGKGGSATANVVITINGTNDPPLAVNDASSVPANAGSVAGNALANDSDPDAADTLTVSAITGGTLGAPLAGTYGSLTLNADGSYSFTPNATTALALAAGATATDTFTYTISDGHGGTSSASITITLSGTNDAPMANADTNSMTEDQATASGNLLTGAGRTDGAGTVTTEPGAADTDPDTGDTLGVIGVITSTNVPGTVGTALAGTYGHLTLAADGSYSYALNTADPAVQALRAGETRIETFTYTVSDGKGGSSSSTLAITISGNNDAPVGEDDSAATTNTAAVSANVLPNDHDQDANPSLTVSALRTGTEAAGTGTAGTVGAALAGTYGSLALNADGTWTYTPSTTAPAVTGLLLGSSLTESFTYTVSDGTSTDTAQLTITIHGTNQAPAAVNDTNAIAEEQTTASGNLLTGARTDGGGTSSSGAPDADPDGDPLTVIDISLPDGYGGVISTSFPGTPLAGLYGGIAVLADGSYQYIIDNGNATVQALKAGETLSESFVYTTSDGRGSFVQATLVITVTGTNDSPVAVADSNSIVEDSTVPATGNVLPNDTDPDANTTLSVSAVSGTGAGTVGGATAGSYGTLTLNADGSYSYLLNNANSTVQALGPGQTLTDSFSYTVSDSAGGTATTTLVITINGDNDPPTATADVVTAQEDGGAVTGDLTPGTGGQDSDVDGGTLVVVGFSNADGASGTAGSGTTLGAALPGLYGGLQVAGDGGFSYAPDGGNSAVQALAAGQSLTETFAYTISDGQGGTATSTLTVTINGVNDAPAMADTLLAITQAEDAAAPSGAVGTLVSALTGGQTDVDTGALDGVAITAANTTLGSWFFSTDNGGTWAPLPAVSDTAALLLRPTDRVYFQPNLNANGSVANGLTVRAWDQTSGAAGTTVSTAANGGTSAFSTATDVVALNVSPVNDPPVGVDDTATAVEAGGTANATAGANGTGNVLTNDTDLDSGDTRSVSALRTGTEAAGTGTAGTLGTALAGTYGSLTLQSDGTYAYVIDETNPAVQALRVTGQTLSDAFTYTARDSGGLSDVAQLTITIDGRNDAPVGVDDTATAVEAGGTANGTPGANGTGNVLTNDTDVDVTGEAKAVSAVRTGTEAAGTGTTGTLGAALAGTYGSLTLNAGGSYTYVINETNPTVQALRTGQSVSESFTYTVSDAGGLTDVAQLTITVNGANDAPAANADTNFAIDGAAHPTGNVLNAVGHTGGYADQADTDIEVDTLSVAQVNGSAGNVGNNVAVTYGSIQIAANGAYTYTLDSLNPAVAGLIPGATLTETVGYQVSDGQGGTATSTLTLTIFGRNNEPTGADNTLTTNEDTPLVISAANFGFADVDTVSPAKDFASVRIDTVPATGALLLDGVAVVAGQIVSKADIDAGKLRFVPPANLAGTGLATFAFSVGDGLDGFDLVPNTITLNVTPVSDAPSLATPVADASNSPQTDPIPLQITLGVTDTNGPAPETLGAAVTISGIPAGATLSNAAGDVIVITAGTATLTPAQLAGLKILPALTQQTDFTLTVSASSIDGAAAPAIATSSLLVRIPLPLVLNAPDPVRATDIDRRDSLTGMLGGTAAGFLGLRANTFTSDMPSVWESGSYNNRVINLPIPLHPIVYVEVTVQREQALREISDALGMGSNVGAVVPREIDITPNGNGLGADPAIFVRHAVLTAEHTRLFLQGVALGRDGRISLSTDGALPHPGIFAPSPAAPFAANAAVDATTPRDSIIATGGELPAMADERQPLVSDASAANPQPGEAVTTDPRTRGALAFSEQIRLAGRTTISPSAGNPWGSQRHAAQRLAGI